MTAESSLAALRAALNARDLPLATARLAKTDLPEEDKQLLTRCMSAAAEDATTPPEPALIRAYVDRFARSLGLAALDMLVARDLSVSLGHRLAVTPLGPAGVLVTMGRRWAIFPLARLQDPETISSYFAHEPFLYSVIAQLRPAEVFVDIGANLGRYSLFAALYAGCHVIAFEPHPANADYLRRVVALNGLQKRIAIHPMALGSKAGEFLLSSQPGGAGVTGTTDPAAQRADDLVQQTVCVDRFDDLVLSGEQNRRFFVKIDVDGAETAVLQGAEKSLRDGNITALYVEIYPEHAGPLIEWLDRLGYGLVRRFQKKNHLFARR